MNNGHIHLNHFPVFPCLYGAGPQQEASLIKSWLSTQKLGVKIMPEAGSVLIGQRDSHQSSGRPHRHRAARLSVIRYRLGVGRGTGQRGGWSQDPRRDLGRSGGTVGRGAWPSPGREKREAESEGKGWLTASQRVVNAITRSTRLYSWSQVARSTRSHGACQYHSMLWST